MSKSEILQELPNLALEDRREILERICELEESEVLRGGKPMPEERAILDQELEDHRLPQIKDSVKWRVLFRPRAEADLRRPLTRR